MSSRILLPLLAFVSGLGCLHTDVTHEARWAPVGDPAGPALRAQRVTMLGYAHMPGQWKPSKGDVVRPVVTRNGAETRDGSGNFPSTVRFGVRVPGGTGGSRLEILDMTWSPPTAPRCAGGHPALELRADVDGPINSSLAEDEQTHWERPIVVDRDRLVTGRFDEDPPLLQRPSVIDVRLVEHRGLEPRETCVRVPVTGPEVKYWGTKKWSVGARVEWRRSLAFTPGSVMTGGIAVGRWVGPVRVGLLAYMGGTSDGPPDKEEAGTTGACFLGPGPDCEEVFVGGFNAELGGLVWRWTTAAIGWSLAYETFLAEVSRYDVVGGTKADRFGAAGGPRLGLQLLGVASLVTGVSKRSPTTAIGFEVFVAAAQSWSGGSSGPPVTYGVALLGF